jgi:integrase
MRFHDLRHTYATWLVDDGVPVNMVQRVMSHERSLTTLDLYTRRTESVRRRDAPGMLRIRATETKSAWSGAR